MIKRMVFYTEYTVHDGMHISEQCMLAKKKNLDLLNKWFETTNIKRIINIQETSYSSHNSDNSPFWERLTCFYESYDGLEVRKKMIS